MHIVKTGVYRAASGFRPESSASGDAWEITLITEGAGTTYAGGRAESFAAGDVFITPPKTPRSASAGAAFEYAYALVDGFLPPTCPPFKLADDENGTGSALTAMLVKSADEAVNDVISEALRRFVLERGMRDLSRQSLDVGGVVRVLSKNFTNPEFKLSDAFAQAGYNRDYFSRRFKAETGVTPGGYLLNLRLTHAAALLKQRSVFGSSVADVAAAGGFYDANYFARVFK